MSNIVSRQRQAIVDHLLISINSAGAVTDEDWQRFLKMLRTPGVTHYLAGSVGKSDITSVQRKEAADLFKSRGIHTAVITDDFLVRGLVTAVGWLGANVQSFAWADMKSALKYLNVAPAMEFLTLAELARLRSEVELLAQKK